MASANALSNRDHPTIGVTVRSLRQRVSMTLSELAKSSGISVSALSKIENGQMSPTYDTMTRLASGLKVDLTELFGVRRTEPVNGRRVVTRSGQGVRVGTPHYDYEMLCSEIANKAFVPLLTTIHARTISEFEEVARHAGEEFFFVLSGSVVLHTEHYAPTRLEAGDSAFFDSGMGHALVCASKEPAQILWIATRVFGPLATDALATE
jgi:transcriptional regulator with XRE-family HTH domain